MERFAVCGILLVTLAGLSGCTENRPIEPNSGFVTSQLRAGMPVNAPTSIVYVNSCNIEQLNEAQSFSQPVALQQGAPLNVGGWVVDDATHQSPAHVFILMQAAVSKEYWWAPISGRVPRQDVAQSRNSTLLSGFKAALDTSPLPPGEYLVLTLFWQDGPSQICDNGRKILLRSSSS